MLRFDWKGRGVSRQEGGDTLMGLGSSEGGKNATDRTDSLEGPLKNEASPSSVGPGRHPFFCLCLWRLPSVAFLCELERYSVIIARRGLAV